MTQPNSSCPSLSKFVAYQLALESARLVRIASLRWRECGDLPDQARRASSSVVLNLAESSGEPRGSLERARFQRYACRSARETLGALDLAAVNGLGDAAELAAARAIANRVVGITVRLTRP